MWKINYCVLIFFFPTFSVASFNSTPDDIIACDGKTVELVWIYEHALDVVMIYWYHSSFNVIITVLFPSQNVSFDLPDNIFHVADGTIKVENVTQENAGEYSIHVYYNISSAHSTLRSSVNVIVLDPPSAPYFTAKGPTYTCHADSYGSPQVQVLIKIGMNLKDSNAAMVDFTENVDCCVVGQAVTCMSEASAATRYCINAITPTGPKNMYLSPSTTVYTVNLEDTLGPIICFATCTPHCTFRWTKGDSPVISNNSTLTYKITDKDDSGFYTCTATRGATITATMSITVNVRYGPDSAVLFPNKVGYIENTGTILPTISCTSNCYPSCSVTWKKQGEGVVSLLDTGNGLLQLGVLAKNKSGVYICTTRNSQLARTATARVTLNVRYGPDKLRTEPAGPNYVVNEGNPLPNISCSADCYPGCSQSWSSETGSIEMAKGGVLSLGTAYRNYTGVYTCTSTNEADVYSKTGVHPVNITVHYHPDATVTQINGTSVTEGIENFMLMCSAKGDPNVHNFTKWIHFAPDGTVIQELKPSFSSKEKAYLKFPNTSYMDSGKYECVVTNGIPSITTGDIFAYAAITQVVKGHPVVTVNSSHVTAALHGNATLTASYYSNDGTQSTVQWYRYTDGSWQEMIYADNKVLFRNGPDTFLLSFYGVQFHQPGNVSQLLLANVSKRDFTSYKVLVLNSIGTTFSSTIQLTPESAPETPKELAVLLDSTTSSTITVTWISGFHGGENQIFHIQYNTSTTPWKDGATVEGFKLIDAIFNATIYQLSSETQYYLRIFAENGFGKSPVSGEIVTARTRSDDAGSTSASSLNIGATVGAAIAGVLIAVVTIVVVIFLLRKNKRFRVSRNKQKRDAVMGFINDHEYVNMNAATGDTACKAGSEQKGENTRLAEQPYESLNTERNSTATYEKLTTANQSDTQRSASSEYDGLDSKMTNKHIYTGLQVETTAKPSREEMAKQRIYDNTMRIPAKDPIDNASGQNAGKDIAGSEAVYSNLMIRNK